MRPKRDKILEKEMRRTMPVAVEAAMEAGAFIKKKFGNFKRLEQKADASLVTEVDKASEVLIAKKFAKNFPHHEFLGEESGLQKVKDKSEFHWHVDPLDGTSNFVHGFPTFCVSIGLEFESRDLVLGVIYHPISGELYTGAVGMGAHLNKKEIQVSKNKTLSESLLCTGFSHKKDKYFKQEMETFARMCFDSHSIRRTGSAALDLVQVACGRFDGFWERGLSPWDVCGALAILRQAGGKYSQFDGKAFHLRDESILATNGLIHSEMIAKLM